VIQFSNLYIEIMFT